MVLIVFNYSQLFVNLNIPKFMFFIIYVYLCKFSEIKTSLVFKFTVECFSTFKNTNFTFLYLNNNNKFEYLEFIQSLLEFIILILIFKKYLQLKISIKLWQSKSFDEYYEHHSKIMRNLLYLPHATSIKKVLINLH